MTPTATVTASEKTTSKSLNPKSQRHQVLNAKEAAEKATKIATANLQKGALDSLTLSLDCKLT